MKFEVFENPKKIYARMLEDIEHAKKSVLLETYIYTDDSIGRKFRESLEKKAKNGIKVYLLVDSHGGRDVRNNFFSKLKKQRGNVRFFNDIHIIKRILKRDYEVNHRKMLIVDNKICYFGSHNITAESLNWRELTLRFEDPLVNHFIYSFKRSWEYSQKLNKKKVELMIHRGYQIIHDIPSNEKRLTQTKYSDLIRKSKKEVLIETPYFVPPLRIRSAMIDAVKRGVKVKILMPKVSDLKFFDIFRNKYLGNLYKNGIEIYYYFPKKSHAKLLLVDDKFFLLGSSNLDYRSFLLDHEINLFGKDKKLYNALEQFFNTGLKHSKPFNYEEWNNRSLVKRIIELIMMKIEKKL